MIAKGDEGFTLIDVAVSLVLMGLLTLLVSTSLPLLSGGANKIVSANGNVEDLASTNRLLRHHLGHVLRKEMADARNGEVSFVGGQRQLTFVSTLPLALQRGNVQTGKISLTHAGQGLIYDPGVDSFKRNLIPAETVLFSYYGKKDKVTGWHEEWKNERTLPRLVRLKIEGVPEMIFPVAVSPEGL